MDERSANHASGFSERLYRLLLRAYPHDFHEEYATEMLRVFRDASLDARRGSERWGVLCFWRVIIGDFITSVCLQRLQSWTQRNEMNAVLAGKEPLAMATQLRLDVAQRTDIGRKRASNEDNLISVVPDDQHISRTKGALFVVSDGLGGHKRGEVASEMTIRIVKDAYYQDPQQDLPAALQAAVKQANAAIYQMNVAEERSGTDAHVMGATCVAAVLHEHRLYVANVGDSRVYVLRGGQLRQITRDHSLVARMVERGELSVTEARTHERRNIIYRSLGLVDVEVDLFTESLEEGDGIILCTDGLCGVVPDDELQAIVERFDPEESVRHLISRANEAGGPDNVTAIVVRVVARR